MIRSGVWISMKSIVCLIFLRCCFGKKYLYCLVLNFEHSFVLILSKCILIITKIVFMYGKVSTLCFIW